MFRIAHPIGSPYCQVFAALRGIHICVFILVALSGCDRLHRRPSVVPRSAVWIDHTFIDCSAEKQSKGNACTVYKDDTGEILADGLFLLDYPARAASEAELRHYAAYGDHTIFLEDAKLLMQKSATRRDPSEQVIRQRLETLASRDATSAIDCNEPGERIAKCALDAFAAKKPFFAHWYLQYPEGFDQLGLAMDHARNLYQVTYSPIKHRPGFLAFAREDQYFDEGHTLVTPCPVYLQHLHEGQQGSLECGISYE
jgi:hypothetical protein